MKSIDIEDMTDRIMKELQQRMMGKPDEWNASTAAPATESAKPSANRPASSDAQGNGDRWTDPLQAASNSALSSPSGRSELNIPQPRSAEMLQELRDATPARIGVWRAGTRPLTKEMLRFRCDHASAVDTVYGEVSDELLASFHLLQVETRYENTENYLKRPDMGRILTDESVEKLHSQCQKKPQVQIVVSGGLSANAVEHNLADVYPALRDSLQTFGLKEGTPIFVKGGRVASMDHIGEIVEPEVLVMLIGERPGLVSSSSMSAYMCYRPRKGMLESNRTVLSNIHHGGTPPVEAGAHIGAIVHKMLEQQTSGVKLVI